MIFFSRKDTLHYRTTEVFTIVILSLVAYMVQSRVPVTFISSRHRSDHSKLISTHIFGWFDSIFSPKAIDDEDDNDDNAPRNRFPQQSPATYDLISFPFPGDNKEARQVRPLLKQTLLENRRLDLVYDANKLGWRSDLFHKAVDGRGPAIVLATCTDNRICGGYNPRGWSGLGGARPSIASFLFYSSSWGKLQKLRKVGGGGLACARDDVSFGISFGPDALVIGLQRGNEKRATSKLGPYFEKGPENLNSLFPGGSCELKNVQVLVGRYEKNERIPDSGAVFDMTSG